MFAALLEQYVGAINAGGVPTISTAWEHVAAAECVEAADAAARTHHARLAKSVFADAAALRPREAGTVSMRPSSE